MCVGVATQYRPKAAAVHGGRVVAHAQRIQQGGQHIVKLNDGLGAPRSLPAGQTDHKRHLEQFAVQAIGALEKLAVVCQRMAVIGQQDDD